jgi:Ca-activated chloride channel family protein
LATQAVHFAAPEHLWLLLAIPALVLLLALAGRARRRARTAWAGQLFTRLAPGFNGRREWSKVSLVFLAWLFVVLALARPQWGGEVVMMKRRGIDLTVAIDTSMSMLAEDVRPNRLEQAKRGVSDLIGRMGGDRIGLIAFAGEAFTVCPLTLDHGTVLLLLESLNVNTVSTPGTNVGDAIQKARAAYVKDDQKHKAFILVTDGESHEGDPLSEAREAAKEGLVVYTIGIGSTEGEPIPDRQESGSVAGYKKDRSGRVVNSRLDEATLRAIARETQGQYFRGTPQGIELTAVLEDLEQMEKKELEGTLATSYEERFQWPLAFAILLLGVELVMPSRRRMPEGDHA